MKILMVLFGNIENDGRVLRSIDTLKNNFKITNYSYCDDIKFKISKVKLIKRKSPKHKKNIFELILFTIQFFRICFKNKYDIIYLHDYFLTFPVKLISYFFSIKIIYDAHELIISERSLRNNNFSDEFFSLNNFKNKKYKINILDNFFYYLEKISIRKFNLIITANEERAIIMKKHYNLTKTPEIVRNIPKISNKYNLYSRFLLEKKIEILKNFKGLIFVYQGLISSKRDIEKIVIKLSEIENSNILIIGDGNKNYIKYLKRLFNQKSLYNIHFLDKVDLKYLYSILKICDLGIISYSNINLNNRYCAPNKLYEYAMFNLPMITTNQVLFKKTFKKYKIGIIYDKTKNIKEEVNALINTNLKDEFQKFNNLNSQSNESSKLFKALKKFNS